jgi:uncharacterized protein YkwD
MHRILSVVRIGLVLLLLSLASPVRQTTAAAPTAYQLYLPLVVTASDIAPERLEVIRLVNAARIEAGCPEARINDNLMAAVQGWSEYMDANSVFHHASGDWYAAYDYPQGALENIGGGGSAEIIFTAWMESPSHKRNMLDCFYFSDPSDPSYDPTRIYEIGVGHVNGYWTLGLSNRLPD